jgi:hypothetical protein
VKELCLKAILILSLFLFCGLICFDVLAVAQEKYAPKEDEITRSYQGAMLNLLRFQEKKFKISYRSVPRLKFLFFPASFSNSGLEIIMEGMYVPEENIIYLANFYRECRAPLLPQNLDDLNGLLYKSSGGNRCNPANIRAILAHELGHAYANQLSLAIGNGNWPDFSSFEDTSEGVWKFVGLKLVSEGMADYFSKVLGEVKDDFLDSEWERLANDPYNTTFPEAVRAGFHFVKPILDKYGEQGMMYLIKNPPIVENMDFKLMPKKQLEALSLVRVTNYLY